MQNAERPLWTHVLSLFFKAHVECVLAHSPLRPLEMPCRVALSGEAICFKGLPTQLVPGGS
jgi:hypothetical protein